jgi:large subunit ribosomal protein L19
MKILKEQLKTVPKIKAGQTVRVHQRIKESGKERVQPFEGLVIATKHGRGLDGTFTVRKISEGIGIERVYPLHSPTIDKIELLSASWRTKVRRAKLYYMRKRFGKKARMKKQKAVIPETQTQTEELSENQNS